MRILLLSCASIFPGAAFSETMVALKMIRPNAVISPEDVGIGANDVPGAIPSGTDIVGLEARVTLYPGQPIMPSQIGPAAVVERNQPVKLVFQQGSLIIETEARALSRGAIGDVIRVMNLSSRATISGRIQHDGSVKVSQRGVGQ